MSRAFFAVAVLAAMAAAMGSASAETIAIGGSGTGIELMHRLGAAYAKHHPSAQFEVPPSLGTSGGIRAVNEGALDVGFAGRELNDAERKFGLQQIPFVNTAFVFVTSNRAVQGVTMAELEAIFRGSKKAWDDGTPIRIILRPPEDADSLYVARKFATIGPLYARLRARPELTVAATDQATAELAETSVGSLTTSNLLQITSERRHLAILALDGIAPNLESVESGRYPFTRIYYLLVKPAPTAKVRDFLAFVGSAEGQTIVRAAGAMPLMRTGD